MDELQKRYNKRKGVYFGLLAALLAIIIAFKFIAPEGEHKTTPLELAMFVCLIGIVIAIYRVFRCPSCNATLVPAYSSLWGKLRCCPSCGAKLAEK